MRKDQQHAELIDQRNNFVRIPAGEFLRSLTDVANAESPMQRVKISRSFEINSYQVVQAQWQAVMGSNPSRFKGPLLPVERVSWYDIEEFLQKLNSSDSKYLYRLPTEAEWEYAGRATVSATDAANIDLDAIAWYRGNSRRKTHPVGEKQPNGWGLYDMLGNVWEWCQDWSADYPVGTLKDPHGPDSGTRRVVRGSSYANAPFCCQFSYRHSQHLHRRYSYLGFRLVRTKRKEQSE